MVRQTDVQQLERAIGATDAASPIAQRLLRLPPIVRAMRPLQWTKNALVFAAVIFTHQALEIGPLLVSIAAALVFCAVSSGIYLLNDIRDLEHDKHHPRKRFRPIPVGEVTVRQAATTSAVLLTAAFISSWLIRPEFTAVIAGYVALMFAYSYGLKRFVILDVFAISAGFVLRAASGAVVLEVPISPWLYVCTMLLALFVGFGKRRSELVLLESQAGRHRANLELYTLPMLDQIIGVLASAIVMAYSLYSFDAAAVPENKSLMLTIPFVLYGIFRYLYLIHRRNLGGSPETLLFSDRPLLICIVGWGLSSIVILSLS